MWYHLKTSTDKTSTDKTSTDKTSKIDINHKHRQTKHRQTKHWQTKHRKLKFAKNVDRQNIDRQNVEITKTSKDPNVDRQNIDRHNVENSRNWIEKVHYDFWKFLHCLQISSFFCKYKPPGHFTARLLVPHWSSPAYLTIHATLSSPLPFLHL